MGHAAAIEDVRRKLREFPFVDEDWKNDNIINFYFGLWGKFWISRSENKYTLYRLILEKTGIQYVFGVMQG